MDLPRPFTIREVNHRIKNPFTEEKLATLGRAIHLQPGASVLDLACGSGELLCTWSRDHGITGTGVDISTVFLKAAEARAVELGVADQVTFVHDDASGYVASTPVDVGACIGATWIGNGTTGTIDLLERSLRPGGLLLIGEVYWRSEPPDQATVEACHVSSKDDMPDLPGLVALFGQQGWDLVEMITADDDGWDRYAAAQWFNIRAWLDANPDDELAEEMRAELDEAPLRHVRHRRKYLGWGVFVLKRR